MQTFQYRRASSEPTPAEIAHQQNQAFKRLENAYNEAKKKQDTAFGSPKPSHSVAFNWKTHNVNEVARDWTGEMLAAVAEIRLLAKAGHHDASVFINKNDAAPKSPVIAPVTSPKI